MPRKVFTAGEVLAASDVNDFLMDQTVMVFAGTAARGSAIPTPSEGMYAHLNDTDSLVYYDGSDWVSAIPASTSAILQVVSTAKTDVFTSASGSFVTVTGLSATITPSSASSKILVLAQVSYAFQSAGVFFGGFKVTRGGTDIYRGNAAGSRTQAVFGGEVSGSQDRVLNSSPINFLDSPASTSALTYQVEVLPRSVTTSINATIGDSVNESSRVRGASSITLMEVAG
jgi:hypothetical protein